MRSSPLFFLISLFLCNTCIAQLREVEAIPAGGREEVEQVLQTQLNLPKVLLSSGLPSELKLYFEIDSAGHATNIIPAERLNNALRAELFRIMRFIYFRNPFSGNDPVQLFYTFHITPEKYSGYPRQRSRWKPEKVKSSDSTFTVYSRADRSPEYYRNGEQGLEEYILAGITYPKIAREKSIQGTVLLEFIVETNGFVTGVHALKGVNGGCSEEAIRLMKETRWNPAVLKDKYVRYRTTYPVTFSLVNNVPSQVQSGD
jgi:TonB family protein